MKVFSIKNKLGILWMTVVASTTLVQQSFSYSDMSLLGSFLGCDSMNERCLWMGPNRSPIETNSLIQHLESLEGISSKHTHARKYMKEHIQYVVNCHIYAKELNHTLGSKFRITTRHFYDVPHSLHKFREHVQNDIHATSISVSRSLRQRKSRRLNDISVGLNWCDGTIGANPLGRSVCTPVKSQQRCGSCWAFSAADAIESAISIATGHQPVDLSPQQLIDCSTESMFSTFDYCWLSNSKFAGSWLASPQRWQSQNEGCNGGMTHIAFQYVAASSYGLLPNLVYPYSEDNNLSPSGICRADKLAETVVNATGRITGWKEAIGKSCSNEDANILFKKALQSQPISVAIVSEGTFAQYAGGMYSCPNSGEIDTSDQINHALVLVGYGTNAGENYWILKNSYGPTWGDRGFMYLREDDILNCGLNVLPVIPLGASGGAVVPVDGGGENTFLDSSFGTWFIAAIIVSSVVLLLIIGSVVFQKVRSDKESVAHRSQETSIATSGDPYL